VYLFSITWIQRPLPTSLFELRRDKSLETQSTQRVFFYFFSVRGPAWRDDHSILRYIKGWPPKRNNPRPFGPLLSCFVFFPQRKANLLFFRRLAFYVCRKSAIDLYDQIGYPALAGPLNGKHKKEIFCVLCGSAVNINPKKECLNNYRRISKHHRHE